MIFDEIFSTNHSQFDFETYKYAQFVKHINYTKNNLNDELQVGKGIEKKLFFQTTTQIHL